MNDQNGKQKLTNMLAALFDSLKVFGKEPEQMLNYNRIFHLVLADYPIDKVEKALIFYIAHNSELPAPSDIVNIIERGNKPPLERSVYISLCDKRRNNPEGMTKADWEYIEDFERWIMTGNR